MPNSKSAFVISLLVLCLITISPSYANAPTTTPDNATTTPKRPSISRGVGKIFGRITQVTTLVEAALELTDFVMDKENTEAKKKDKDDEFEFIYHAYPNKEFKSEAEAAAYVASTQVFKNTCKGGYTRYDTHSVDKSLYYVYCTDRFGKETTGGAFTKVKRRKMFAIPKPDTPDQPNPKTEPVPTIKPGTKPTFPSTQPNPFPDRVAPNDPDYVPPAKPKPGEKPANDPAYNPPTKPDTKPKPERERDNPKAPPTTTPAPTTPAVPAVPGVQPDKAPTKNPDKEKENNPDKDKDDETNPDKKKDPLKNPDKQPDKNPDKDKDKDKDDEQDPNKKTDPDKNPGKDNADDKKDPTKDKDKDPTKDKEKQDPAKDKDKDKPKTGTQTTTTTTTDVELDFELPDFCDWAKWICEDDLENKDDSRVDIETEPIPIDSVSIRFGGTCPGDSTFPFVIGGQQLTFTLSYQYVCQIALAMGGIVKILSTIVAMYILTGIKS